MTEKHDGWLLGWGNESRPGENGKTDIVVVGIVEDAETHVIKTIPYNRIIINQ